MKKILVTGHLGYIGTHLVELLKKENYFVIGCDLSLFNGCEFDSFTQPDLEIIKDFRQLTIKDLQGVDCIMHLAAISNDPMGDLDPEITYGINREGTIELAKIAKGAGVSLFLFASSCSIYGKGSSLDITEEGEVCPLTPYAKSKIDAEISLKELSDDSFKTVSLRNATAYGYSPMLRIDLVVNNLLACAIARSEIRVMSDGSPWRPLIHCRDIARAFVAFYKNPPMSSSTHVNVGNNKQNYQVKDIVEMIQRRLPHTKVVYTGEVGQDPRNYRVNFDLFSKLLPDFKMQYDLEAGIDELFTKYKLHGFSLNDFEGDRYVRLRILKKRLHLIQNEVYSNPL